MRNQIPLEVLLPLENPPQAIALAQFVKRVTWSEIRSCAVDDDEAHLIRDAIEALQRALAEAGFSPR
jgi:hypothetical protein